MRLIDADALPVYESELSVRKGKRLYFCPTEAIVNAPTIEAEPVRHGRWQITDAYPHNVYCSACHTRFAQTHWEVWEDGSLPRAYCPNCGAKMDGDTVD